MSQAEGVSTLTVTSESDLKLVIEKSTEEKVAFEVKGLSLVFEDKGEMKFIRKWCESQGIKLN